MKLLRWGAPGQERPGIVLDDGSIGDLSHYIDDIGGMNLSKTALKRLAAVERDKLARVSPSERIGACVGSVGHFLAVGLNYAAHIREANAEFPNEPVIFSKAPSCITGPFDNTLKPRTFDKLDYEVELAVVIGENTFRAGTHEALDRVAGVCVCNDISERGCQLERGGQWLKGKSFPTFGPLGPWLVTLEELDDLGGLRMWLEVDGHRRQDASTADMIFDVPFLISYISHFMLLQPGDVIATGTPPGVALGMRQPEYLSAGNVVTLGIEGLGSQKQEIVDAP